MRFECKKCGSIEVDALLWVDLREMNVYEQDIDLNKGWCSDCKEDCVIIQKKEEE